MFFDVHVTCPQEAVQHGISKDRKIRQLRVLRQIMSGSVFPGALGSNVLEARGVQGSTAIFGLPPWEGDLAASHAFRCFRLPRLLERTRRGHYPIMRNIHILHVLHRGLSARPRVPPTRCGQWRSFARSPRCCRRDRQAQSLAVTVACTPGRPASGLLVRKYLHASHRSWKLEGRWF